MNARTIISLSAGFGLLSASKAVEAHGDAFKEASSRLTWHLSALVLLVFAGGLFIHAGLSAFRRR